MKPIAKPIWTPLQLELMLRTYYSPPYSVDYRSDSQWEGLKKLDDCGLIHLQECMGEPNFHTCECTEKGHAFVGMLLSVPQPEQAWGWPEDKP